MERQTLQRADKVRADGANDLQPGRQRLEMFSDEGADRLAVISPVSLALVEAVDEDDALARAQRPLALQRLERVEDPVDEGSVRI